MQPIAPHNVFFTADLHFGHVGMITKARRPYASVDIMNRELVRQWNMQVKKTDHVFILGDLSFMSHGRTMEVMNSLNGNLYLIEGNHDKLNVALREKFVWIKPLHEIKIGEQRIVMCHYAMRVWNRSHYGAWQLHGHSHGNLEGQGLQLDVGVDSKVHRSGLLYSFYDVQNYMRGRQIGVVDHHKPKDLPDVKLLPGESVAHAEERLSWEKHGPFSKRRLLGNLETPELLRLVENLSEPLDKPLLGP